AVSRCSSTDYRSSNLSSRRVRTRQTAVFLVGGERARPGAARLQTHTPPHGAFGTLPAVSGKNAKRRMRNDSRWSAAAVWSSEPTSTGVHPSRLKKAGPSLGANFNRAPAWLRFL